MARTTWMKILGTLYLYHLPTVVGSKEEVQIIFDKAVIPATSGNLPGHSHHICLGGATELLDS